VLSLWVAWQAQDDPARTLADAANLLGSDTDTIATMAGALIGAIRPERPPGVIQDEDYIVGEARRCAALARGEGVEDFPHPDVIDWQAPRTLVDAVGRGPDGAMLAGLGGVEEASNIFEGTSSREDGGWQWLSLWFGQRVLAKRRRDLAPLPPSALPRLRPMRLPFDERPHALDVRQSAVEEPVHPRGQSTSSPIATHQGLTARGAETAALLDDALDLVKNRRFEPEQIGATVLALLEGEGGLERAAVFLGALAEAYRAHRGHAG
jgi:hypothetical protein